MTRLLTTFLMLAWLVSPALAQAPVPAQTPASEESLIDELWVQTSADYRAQCYQVYGWALSVLQERIRLEQPPKDGDGRLTSRTWLPGPPMQQVVRPLAVVMDLDETVIDNSAYQVFLALTSAHYTPTSWRGFVQYQADHPQFIHSVPGALDFIKTAQGLGYTILFVSNRTEQDRPETLRVLTTLGLAAPDLNQRLLLDPGEKEDAQAAQGVVKALGLPADGPEARRIIEGQGRKERRRLELRARFRAVEFLGDDLGDFLSFYKDPKASTYDVLQARYAEVERNKGAWGREWFFIPNPMYGNWQPGITLPRQDLYKLLHDDGFTEYWQKAGSGK